MTAVSATLLVFQLRSDLRNNLRVSARITHFYLLECLREGVRFVDLFV